MRIMRWTMIAMMAAGLVAPAPTMAREADKVLMAENAEARAFQEAVGYAEAVIAGDTIYLSGVVAAPAGEGQAGLDAGYDRAFKHIAATLARAGASWDDVVDITTFHTDLPAHIDGFAAVKNRYVRRPFRRGPRSACRGCTSRPRWSRSRWWR
ncbi:Rid family hydrolase [Sphingopyxis sp. YR583]|uniref:Rid family hydrolase n=1 Tax=Sphingopyxis sp. YR583 TaxID=1881047 RepID=UPI000B8091C4|nr:Rid family hydrolase [Sphingopyxis sp. YR583]